MNEPLPLFQHQPLERFSSRATDYARFRPGYPSAAFDAILNGLSGPLQVADIGAGTGISARALAGRGHFVTAIEPNAAMRAAALSDPNIRFLDGTAESTGLPGASQDLVTCFQAFHWFNPPLCLPEFRRILRFPGRLAIVWNDRDEADNFTAGYSEIIREASALHPAAERAGSDAVLALLQQAAGFEQAQMLTFANSQSLDSEALVGRVRSSSYIPLDESAQRQLLDQLHSLHREHVDVNGLVHLRYLTQVFLVEAAG